MADGEWRLNDRAAALARRIIETAPPGSIAVDTVAGATVIDVGVTAPGGLEIGRQLAELCLAGWGAVHIAADRLDGQPCPRVTVATDAPLPACLWSQYAGWQVAVDKYFAMGSGPMRAARAREPVFEKYPYFECADAAVGVLETGKLPPAAVIESLRGALGERAKELIVLVARTASIAGSLQVVARSVETCLHQMVEVGFDVRRVRSALGSALLPPTSKNDLIAIGRTNDSILYGGEVTLWIDEDDALIRELAPKLPSSTSPDHGAPFRAIFERYGGDFYKIDPHLFSPAAVVIHNLRTGVRHAHGAPDWGLVAASFHQE